MFALLLVSLSAASRFSPLQTNANCNSQNGTVGDYNMTLLATWWVATQCLLYSPGEGIGPVPGTNNVTIHGLWAEHNSSSYPTCCDTSYTFDSSEIENVTDLTTNWVSSTGTDEYLYAHEWEKHGTCTLDNFPNEYSYFQNVVNLNNKLAFVYSI